MPKILSYFEAELSALKQAGKAFSDTHKDVAHRIGLDNEQDPHIKRLIEAVAFLNARVHLRADELLPQLTQSLLNFIAPHFLQPFPSMSIVQFQDVVSKGVVPRHTPLFYQTESLCILRTLYPLTLSPLILHDVDVVSKHHYDVQTAWQDRFLELPPYFLRLKLEGECSDFTFHIQHPENLHRVYHTLFSEGRVLFSDKEHCATLLSKEHLHLLGFEREETALLPSISHHQTLLQEYFHFPEKFMFARIGPLKTKGPFEILLPLQEQMKITKEHILLHCTPVVNLFPHTCEPLRFTHEKTDFLITPHAQQKMDLYKVEKVQALFQKDKIFIPSLIEEEAEKFSWTTKQSGEDSYLVIEDQDLFLQDESILHIQALCTNQDQPCAIAPQSLFEMELALKAKPYCIKRPSQPFYPSTDNVLLWKIVRLLTTDEKDIQNILPLYGFKDKIKICQNPKVRRIKEEAWRGFVPGLEFTVETNQFLLGCVLKHYFNLIADIHSFIDVNILNS